MRISIYLSLIVAIVLSTACEDDLNTVPEVKNTSAGFYKTEADIEAAVNAAYAGLQKSGLYGYNYHILMECRSDNTFEESPTSSGGYGDIDLFNKNTSNSVIKNTWSQTYKTIQAANIVLNRIDVIDDMSADLKSARKGEVKFIRALLYYNLVNLYGDVPLVTKETTDPTDYFGQGRTPLAEVYQQIITDLTEAASELPSTNGTGRATKGAANALLGKVYLTIGDPAKAETALRSVTGYSWIPKYSNLFGVDNENNAASIFEVQYESNINGNSEGSKFAAKFTAQANPGSKGNNIITQDLIDSFEPGDLRRNEIIPDRQNSSLFISTKYIDDNRTVLEDGANNVIVLRYADVVLMLAEALNEKGYVADGEAFSLINQVRKRAGLADLTAATVSSQEAFRAALLKERRHEFFYECHRWFDLKRLGDPVKVMNAHFAGIPGRNITIAATDLLYPIPQNQIDTDPDFMKQNPGY
ncbi:RagB/SusD family nutrient uptake outer membrane protein [Marinifilum caeruleilacunae]|uniref:RagB/SusD family nutrient uptake outer membrane protein n=1 Tax=Marinifilum caeruleilacunae TaxID=2499076 RepID=A0ABX1WS08_9BACT|nr:RagB/SusD family nutrient uptake outer membrane protein [Marinifilum caeruleilacunae]NOU58714.1 RagB/SusD family nutrient uptake outer membrane protein [Marinifilum caeruleilacunae]